MIKFKKIYLLYVVIAVIVIPAGSFFAWQRFKSGPDIVIDSHLSVPRREVLTKEQGDLYGTLSNDKNNIETYVRLGEVERLLGNLSASERIYTQGLKKKKDDSRLYIGLALTNIDVGNYEQADKLLRRATELNSADVVGFQAMIDLYNRHFPGQADELDNIYRAASDYTNNPDIWAQYAKFLEDRRDFRQAFIYWEAASFYRPDDRKLKENLERVSKILEAKQ